MAGEVIQYTVPLGIEKVRADKVLADFFTDWSRGQLQSVFEAGKVTLLGRAIKKNTKISSGDLIELMLPQIPATELQPAAIPLDILFEDEHIVCINKSSGMVTHPGSGTNDDTVVHALLHHTRGTLSMAGGKERPGVVHRLDKETSGVMVFAKTDAAYVRLVKTFSERQATKIYWALCLGAPPLESGTIKKPIVRNPANRTKMCVSDAGKFAHTDWRVLERFGREYALLRCHIHTGRTHQIRVHLSDLKYPIVGDTTYGYRPPANRRVLPERVLLHAIHLQLEHPLVSGLILNLEAPLPHDFEQVLASLRQQFLT